MSEVNDLRPEAVLSNENKVSDDELDFEGTEVVVTSEDAVVTSIEQVVEEDVSDDIVSISGRKLSDEVEISNEVSAPQKKVRDEVTHDHSYGISKSPRRLKRQIDGVID